MAAQPEVGIGDMGQSSLLVFPVTPIMGSPALHKWVPNRLALTLGPHLQPQQNMRPAPSTTTNIPTNQPTLQSTPPLLDVALTNQVTVAVMAALRASGNAIPPVTDGKQPVRPTALSNSQN